MKIIKLRRIVIVIAFVILHTIITTADPDYWDILIWRYTGIPPYYHPEYMEMYRWNRLVKKYSIKIASEKYDRGEFE